MEYQPGDLKRLQSAELSILKEIDELCTRHDIPYFLESGSALGAMRHGGFIPWDDDIDIGMLRPDYERFLQLAAIELSETCELLVPGISDHYAAMFAKVMRKGTKFYTNETLEAGLHQGIFVDVFPYDDLSTDESIAQAQIASGRTWQSVSYLYHAKTINVPHKGVLGSAERLGCRCAHHLIHFALSEDRIYEQFRKRTQCIGEPSDLCVAFAWPVENGFEKRRLIPARRIPFEGLSLPVPADTEYYLEKVFGSDWRQLPPVDERRNHAPIILEFAQEEA